MHEVIKEQLDSIREGMLEHTDSTEEVMAVNAMTDEELLVLVFDNLYVAKGQEGYLLASLLNGSY